MKRTLLALTILAAGCGGKVAHVAAAPQAADGGAMIVNVAWPARPANARVIPTASNSIVVKLLQNGVVKDTGTINRPNNAYTSKKLPAGYYTLSAVAYPNVGGTGTPDASGTSGVTLVANSTVASSVTMESTVSTVAINPAAPVAIVGDTPTLSVSAKNAAGAVVLVAPTTVYWTSSNPAVATIDANGTSVVAHALAAGATTLTVQFRETQSGGYISKTATMTVNNPPVTPPGPATTSWPFGRGAATNAGVGTGSGATGNVALWTANPSSSTYYRDSVVVGQTGNLFAVTSDGHVAALLRGSGAPLWSVALGSSAVGGVAATSGDVVYATANGTLYALNASTGATVWTFAGTTGVTSAPVIGADGTVYYGDGGGTLYAISGGAKLWATTIGTTSGGFGGGGTSNVALGANGYVYASGYSGFSGKLYALRAATGATVWTSTLATGNPVVGPNGNVYVVSGSVYALSGTTGVKVWSLSLGGNSPSEIAVQGTSVYVADTLGNSGGFGGGAVSTRAFALNASNGAQIWTKTLVASGGPTPGAPAVAADGTVYVAAGNTVHALTGTSGALRWSHALTAASSGSYVDEMAVDGDGSLYVTIPSYAGGGFGSGAVGLYAVR